MDSPSRTNPLPTAGASIAAPAVALRLKPVGPARGRRGKGHVALGFIITGNPEAADLTFLRNQLQGRGFVEMAADAANFVLKWGPKQKVNYHNLVEPQRVNHFEYDHELTTKAGLAHNLQTSASLLADTDPRTFYPVTFDLTSSEQMDEFALEFKVSKALCLLKSWLAHLDSGHDLETSFQEDVVRVAFTVLSRRLEDVDKLLISEECAGEQAHFFVREREWEILQEVDLESPSKLIGALEKQKKLQIRRARRRRSKQQGQVQQQGPQEEQQVDADLASQADAETDINGNVPSGDDLVEAVRAVLNETRSNPQAELYEKNIWIMKPTLGLKGMGITVENSLDQICERASASKGMFNSNYVCQKYIENPLLIFGTRKHDIRQWVLVTCANPLTIWFFNECYIRIAANEYTVDNLSDQFTHLTHTTIMKQHPNWDPDDENWRCQWDLPTYRNFLKDQFGSDVWVTKILPAMKKIVMTSMLCVQEAFARPASSCCSFQLFGYDFLVDTKLNVWILEVNDIPMLSPTSPVTEKLCNACLQDILSLVLDGDGNRAKGTCQFELLYRGALAPKLPGDASNATLVIAGKGVALPKKASAAKKQRQSDQDTNSAVQKRERPGKEHTQRTDQQKNPAQKATAKSRSKRKTPSPEPAT